MGWHLIVASCEMALDEAGGSKGAALEAVLLLALHHRLELSLIERVDLDRSRATSMHADQGEPGTAWHPLYVVSAVPEDQKTSHHAMTVFFAFSRESSGHEGVAPRVPTGLPFKGGSFPTTRQPRISPP